MSSIKLQGNANGTGILTIEAPDTNTDRSFEIPDTSGTFAMTSQVGRRNLIINGAMQVAQRGTSFTNDSGYKLDRWVVGNPATNSVSQQFSTTLGMYYMDVTTSAGWGTYQWIENVNARHLKAGDKVTVSYWTNVTSGDFNITTTSTSPVSYSTTTIDTASGWYRRSAVVTISSGQASDIASGGHLKLAIEPSSNTFYITGVQLEVGSVATPFEHRSYGEELALCQRYYWKQSADNSFMAVKWMESGRTYDNRYLSEHYFPVTMRTTPTFTVSCVDIHFMGVAFSPVSGASANGTKDNAYVEYTMDSALDSNIVGRPRSFVLTADAEL